MNNFLLAADFSSTAKSAAEYTVEFLKHFPGSKLTIIHCYSIKSELGFLGLSKNPSKEEKENAINRIEQELDSWRMVMLDINPKLSIETVVVEADPKNYIPEYSKKHNIDLIITGSKGMTAIKDLTFGSVSEALFTRSDCPVLIIPPNTPFKEVDRIVFGVDNKIIQHADTVTALANICKNFGGRINMVHILSENEGDYEYDPALNIYLDGCDINYDAIPQKRSIAYTLDRYAERTEAKLLCMIHHPKNWFQNLLNLSKTKSELYDLSLPLLVLHDI